MNKNNFRKIGKIKSSHGIKGEIFLFIFSKDNSWVKSNMNIYLSSSAESSVNSNYTSYVIKKAKPHKDGIIAFLDGVLSRNESDLLIGKDVSVDKSVFISSDQQSIYLVEIENFEMIDDKLGGIGIIKGFSTNGTQDLLIVESKNKTYEIPFVKDFISRMDFDKKIVYAKLPEGLLEINDELKNANEDEN